MTVLLVTQAITLLILLWMLAKAWRLKALHCYIAKDEWPEGEFRILMKRRSPIQRVAVVEYGNALHVYGNGYIQFETSVVESMFAEAIVHVPLSVPAQSKRVLLIGCAGGVTVREVLKYHGIESIYAVDADPIYMDIGKHMKPLVEYNRGSLNNPKVTTIVQDGREFVEGCKELWDVIIVDLPEPTFENPGLSRLFSTEFYAMLFERLASDGAVCIACSIPTQSPAYLWSIEATLKDAGFNTLPYRLDTYVEAEEDWGFCLAVKAPINAEDIKFKIKTDYIYGEALDDLFQIPYGIRKFKGAAEVQRDDNLVLAKQQ